MKLKIINGIECYNPEVLESYSNFPDYGFNESADYSEGNFWVKSRNRIFKKLLIMESQHYKEVNFLEIGCNNGDFISNILDIKQLKITASEIYLKGLLLAKARMPNIRFIQLDITNSRFKNESFEIIAAFDVLEHIKNDSKALSKINKLLRKNGKLILSVPQYKFLWGRLDELVKHQRRYTKTDLKNKLENAGFKVEYISSFVFSLFPFMLTSRLLSLRPYKTKTHILNKNEFKSSIKFPKILDYTFDKIMKIDEFLISKKISLPFGGTLICIAKK
jgi:SAM-dependent methyltransferase